jgi:hypothetical protein
VAATPSQHEGKAVNTPHGLKEKFYFIEDPADFNSTSAWPIRRKQDYEKQKLEKMIDWYRKARDASNEKHYA